MNTFGKIQKTMFCPLCGENHPVSIVTKESQALIKGEKVTFSMMVYVCDNCSDENEFTPSGIMDENLLAAQNAYREAKKKG